MTLLELVVSLTIVGIAVSGGYAALALLGDRRDALVEQSSATARASATRAMVATWLAAATLDPVRVGESFRGLDHAVAGLPDDALTFLTLAQTPLEVPRTLVTLRIARDSAGRPQGLVADLRDWDGTRAETVALEEHASSFDVRYRSSLRSESGWLPSWFTGTILPRGAELTIGAGEPGALDPLLALPIVVAFEGAR